jgi:putative Mn2+ efflux pump MntP
MFALALLALALSMDAFAAALSQGAAGAGRGAALRIGAAFGFAQGVMPLLGWGLGLAFARALQAVDHWIALVLLSALGLKMLREAFSAGGEAPKQLAGWALFTAAIATSIETTESDPDYPAGCGRGKFPPSAAYCAACDDGTCSSPYENACNCAKDCTGQRL